jgi:hypothetical protein
MARKRGATVSPTVRTRRAAPGKASADGRRKDAVKQAAGRKGRAAQGPGRTPGSGRKKGTPNKRTEEFAALLVASGYEPGQLTIAVARGDAFEQTVVTPEGKTVTVTAPASLELRAKCDMHLMRFRWPQLKAIEHSQATDEEGNVRPFMVDFASLPGWLKDSRNPNREG